MHTFLWKKNILNLVMTWSLCIFKAKKYVRIKEISWCLCSILQEIKAKYEFYAVYYVRSKPSDFQLGSNFYH